MSIIYPSLAYVDVHLILTLLFVSTICVSTNGVDYMDLQDCHAQGEIVVDVFEEEGGGLDIIERRRRSCMAMPI